MVASETGVVLTCGVLAMQLAGIDVDGQVIPHPQQEIAAARLLLDQLAIGAVPGGVHAEGMGSIPLDVDVLGIWLCAGRAGM